ncbi:MAG: mitochondrial fission ELM1 family protein [Candidatus Puniceispirillaceae bacterium]
MSIIDLYSAPDFIPHTVGQKPAHSRDKAASIRVISDGTTGMRLQALALGEAIKASRHPATNLEDIITAPPTILRHFPRLAGYLPLSWLSLIVGPKLAGLTVSDPAIIITCGRRMAGLSVAMRRLGRMGTTEGRTRTIHIQDPRLPPQYFDILIAPQHDPTRGPNVIKSMASLNRLNDAKIAQAAATLDSKWTSLPAPCIAVLLGGDNQRYHVSAAMVENMAEKLRKFAASASASLALIPSRRTPCKLLSQLIVSLKTTPHAVMDSRDENPYPGILGHAVAIIVTSDSVNMASEAAVTGKPVLIAEWKAETGRVDAFHKAMMKAGHTAPLGTDIPKTAFIPLFEMPFILRRVEDLLLR